MGAGTAVEPRAPGEETGRARLVSRCYRVLAVAFRYPDAAGQREAAALGPPPAGAPEAPADLAESLAALEAALRAAPLEHRERQHVAAFGHVTVPDCPLHETACGGGDAFRQAQTLADLAGFYRAFGLEVGPEARERADHLAIELEFMHYLAYREAHALEHHGSEAAAVIRDGERRFLAEHLGRWAPQVARAVQSRAEEPLAAAAALLERLLAWESERWGIRPAEPMPAPLPPASGWPDECPDEEWGDDP